MTLFNRRCQCPAGAEVYKSVFALFNVFTCKQRNINM